MIRGKNPVDEDSSSAALQLFDELVQLPAADRLAFLNHNITDPKTRGEVESLLAAYDDAGEFLAEPARLAADFDPLGVGARLGWYELLELLGEGGFARVFRAQQSHPVRREVAIKIIKLGMDTRAVIQRFELERQALAMMDHPNIAAVYDAGATDSGRPYFVMELVRGPRITRYCDQHQLDTRARIRLFIDACHAVQHAHTKGMLHRDIKPSNILVATVDEHPLPKVIDFGIAKAVQPDAIELTMITTERQMLGTPQYMSPEQARSGGRDVDTRSDIFSLGTVLYELLTGKAPLDAAPGTSGALQAIARLTSDDELPRASSTAASPELKRQLRGELDWIIGKSLAKDRSRRYDSVANLAADLQAYLEHRPITAAPPSALYRARKFVRRNATVVIASALVLAALIVGSVVSTMQAIRAMRAERLAHKRLQDTEMANADLTAVNNFLTRDVIGSAEPGVKRGRELTVQNALDNAAANVARNFPGHPLTEAAVRDSVAMAYLSLGHPDLALPHEQVVLENRRLALGEAHPDTIAATQHYGQILYALGRTAEAESSFKSAVDRSRRTLGDGDPRTIAAVHSYGELLSSQGRLAEAEVLCRQAWEQARTAFGADNPGAIAALHDYALVLHRQGKQTQAEPLLRQAIERFQRVKGKDHPDTITSVNALALVLVELGRSAEAEPLYKSALESRRRVLGEDHSETLTALHNYAGALFRLGREKEALPLLLDLLQRRRRLQGDNHPLTLSAMNACADCLRSLGRFSESAQVHNEALERRRQVLGPDHPDTLASLSNYAVVLWALGRFDEAEVMHKEAVERARRVLGDDHPQTLSSLNNYATMLSAQRRYADAEPLQKDLVAAMQRVRGADHPNTIYSMNNYAATLVALGRLDEAARLYGEVYERSPRAQISPQMAATLMASYGPVLVRLKRYQDAEAPLREAYHRLRETNQATHPKMRTVLSALVALDEQTDRGNEADRWRAELKAISAPTTTTRAATSAPLK